MGTYVFSQVRLALTTGPVLATAPVSEQRCESRDLRAANVRDIIL